MFKKKEREYQDSIFGSWSKLSLTSSSHSEQKTTPQFSLRFEEPHISTVSLTGNTELHIAIEQFEKITQLQLFLTRVGNETAALMAKTLNLKDQLPIEIVGYLQIDNEIKQQIYQLLLPLTLPSIGFKSLNQRLEVEEIEEYFNEDEYYQNVLRTAVAAVNYARSIIKESTTHPESNFWKAEQRADVNKKISGLRSELYKRLHRTVAAQFQDCTFRPKSKQATAPQCRRFKVFFSKKAAEQYSEASLDLMREYKVGNCKELAVIALEFLQNQGIENAQIFGISRGDHNFVMIGPVGKRIVCDPWSGMVYREQNIDKNLYSHKRFVIDKKSYHVLAKYNPKIHEISARDYRNSDKILARIPLTSFNLTAMPADKFIRFYFEFYPNLINLIHYNLTSEKEINSLKNAERVVEILFNNPFVLKYFCRNLITLSDLDAVEPKVLETFSNKKHFKCWLSNVNNNEIAKIHGRDSINNIYKP